MNGLNSFRLKACTADRDDEAARVMAEAFADDPGMAYIVDASPPALRTQRIHHLCRYFVAYTKCAGEVILATSDGKPVGVSCLLPPGRTSPGIATELSAGGWRLPHQLGATAFARAIRLSSALATRHAHAMRNTKHWYLFQMAVIPGMQRCGLGRMLMQDLLGKARRDRVPVYLETFLPANVGYYQSYGFQSGAVPARSASSSKLPPFHAMSCGNRTEPLASPIGAQRLYLR
jgi:GNAT superfamily N-acetyltransferase